MSTATATAVQTTWKVDPAHSHVEFAIRHLMIATVKGQFTRIEGTLTGDDDDPQAASIELTIPAAGIDTREPQRDAHLRSSDFFDVERYPAVRFRSTRIRRAGEGTYLVDGELTIRDVTKPLTLTVHAGGRGRDTEGVERVAYSTATSLNRRDFGLTWNQHLDSGGVLIGDEVRVAIELELVKDGGAADSR